MDVVENAPRTPTITASLSTSDGFTVESNFETPDELRASLGIEPAEPPAPKAPDAAPEPVRRESAVPVREEPPTRSHRRGNPRAAVEAAVASQREAERLAAEAAARAERAEAELAEARRARVAPPVAATPVAPAPVATPSVAVVPASPAAPTLAEWERYRALPDAPQLFAADGATPNFRTLEDYNAAMALFIADKRFDERELRRDQERSTRQTWTAFHERVAAAKTADPDFDAKMERTPIDKRVVPSLVKLENAPAVMLHLHTHPDLAQRLLTLHPDDQIGEIRELSGYLKAQAAVAPASPASTRLVDISTAKPPTKRVGGAPPAPPEEPPGDDATEAEYEAYWGPRRQSLRRRRR